MFSIRIKQLACLLFGLLFVASCASSVSQDGGGSQTATPSGAPATPTATVDPSNVSQLLARSHERGPQDATYTLNETLQSSQGTAVGSGQALFTRTPDRFLLDVQSNSPALARHQIYDYTTMKITSTRNGTTSSSTSHIEHYYELHNGTYLGKETVNGETAYHVTGILHQDTLAVPTDLWIRAADLYVVKVMEHVQAQGITDDIAYTNPVFNTGATIPAP
jgi:hypothetical protein